MLDKKGQTQTKEKRKDIHTSSILEELFELLRDKEDYRF